MTGKHTREDKSSIEQRVKLNLTVSRETYDFIKETGINASRLMDHAINAVKMSTATNETQIVMITSGNPKKTADYGPVRIRTGDLRRVRATS